jgi:hypothetical protein
MVSGWHVALPHVDCCWHPVSHTAEPAPAPVPVSATQQSVLAVHVVPPEQQS